MSEYKSQRLADYLRQVMKEKDIDGQKIEDRAKRLRHEIDRTYISRILSGKLHNPTMKKIAALAAGLGVDPVEVCTVAFGGKAIDDPQFRESLYGQVWEMAKHLPADQRAALEHALQLFIRGLEGGTFVVAPAQEGDSKTKSS